MEALSCLDHANFVKNLSENHDLTALKEFFSKCVSHSTALITEASKKSAVASSATAGEIFLKLENAQLIEPRGRFDVSIGAGGVLLDGKV
jgi:hypothetical protein